MPIVQILFICPRIIEQIYGVDLLFHEATFAQSEQARREKKPFTQLLRKLEKSPVPQK